MIKSFTALAIFSLLGAAVVALPSIAPPALAVETTALAKADQLAVGPIAGNCSQQIWPNFDASCLRSEKPGIIVHEVRQITAQATVQVTAQANARR
ncbi:hypothetical protein [Bradyrhizobium sp.]|uniref:hypothetical protein n=1 Tax=Bradyrhizobium sp. TaxID=376 RepID=UPI003C66CDE5